MSDSVEDQFLCEGIDRYVQAHDTIAAFETMLQERLRGIVKTYSFDHFTPTKTQSNSGTGAGPSGRWVWAAQQGKLKSKGAVYLEIGVWWAEGEIALYCDFCDDSGKALPFVYKNENSRIVFKLWGRSSRLFAKTTKAQYSAMKADFDILVGELADSFS